jgi:hypothetical protein
MDAFLENAYSGERYQAVVPDTLDLADRAALAINGLGGVIDPALHYQMYFLVRYASRTPYMQHHGADTTCDPKLAESFAMMRLMCGSSQYADVEAGQRAELVSRIEDGLYWNRVDPARPWRNSYNPAFDGERKDENLSNVGGTGRMMRALLAWRELDGGAPQWHKLIRELAEGLRRIAVFHDDYAYYPDGGFGEPFNYPRSGWLRTDEPKGETEGGEGSVVCYQGHQIQALARWYAASGDPAALDLAGRLTRFSMLSKFWGGVPDLAHRAEGVVGHVAAALPDPACVAGHEQGHWYSHFHARAIALRGMLEYARAANDLRVLEFVRRAYEYTMTLGIPRIGWVDCYPAAINMVEGCALGDLVALGVRLTDAGVGDYWDDVDAVVRNHLVEQQLTRADLLEKIAARSPEPKPGEALTTPGQTYTGSDVIARSLGNYAGHSSPTSIPNPWVMQCCTGNGTQGLYYAWEAILREDGDTTQVNLLLNRAAKSLDVDSYLPYEGKAVFHVKTARRLFVRVPTWVERRELRLGVSGRPREHLWAGNFLLVDDLKPGDQVVLKFPVRETTASYTVASRTQDERTYWCVFRGSTLVDISPRDETPTSYPLYLREDLRADQAPMKRATRFVADKTLLHW